MGRGDAAAVAALKLPHCTSVQARRVVEIIGATNLHNIALGVHLSQTLQRDLINLFFRKGV